MPKLSNCTVSNYMVYWNGILLSFLRELAAVRQTIIFGMIRADERQAVLDHVGQSAAEQWLSETAQTLSNTEVANYIRHGVVDPSRSSAQTPSSSSSSIPPVGTARNRRDTSRSQSRARNAQHGVKPWAPTLGRGK